MRYLGESKIGKLRPRRSKIYPMIRLPVECLNIVGQTARIFAYEEKGVRGLFIALGSEANDRNVAQHQPKVAQPMTQNDINSRLSAIESQITELKSLIFQEGSLADADREKKRPRARFEPASWPPGRRRTSTQVERRSFLGSHSSSCS